MVENKMTVGNEENSIGVAVFMATIITSNANRMLRVNNMSSMTGGRGRISIVKINKMTAGTANEEARKPSVSCRRSDIVKALVAILLLYLLVLRQFVGASARSKVVLQEACLNISAVFQALVQLKL